MFLINIPLFGTYHKLLFNTYLCKFHSIICTVVISALVILMLVIDLFSQKKTVGMKRKYIPRDLNRQGNKRFKSNSSSKSGQKDEKKYKGRGTKQVHNNKPFSKKSVIKSNFGKKATSKSKKKVMGSKVHKGQRHR